MQLLKRLIILMPSLFAVASVYAFNTDFLSRTPVYYFTKQDWDISGAASYKALEHAKDGEKVMWRNPQSGASGYFLPSHTQGNCRYLKLFNKAHDITSITEYKFCKMNGEWKVVD